MNIEIKVYWSLDKQLNAFTIKLSRCDIKSFQSLTLYNKIKAIFVQQSDN